MEIRDASGGFKRSGVGTGGAVAGTEALRALIATEASAALYKQGTSNVGVYSTPRSFTASVTQLTHAFKPFPHGCWGRSSPGWTRTNNPPVNSRMLCQLSYRGRQRP